MIPLRSTILAAALAAAFGAEAAGTAAVAYPDGYRQWTHVKSMQIHPGHPLYDAFGGVHHLYANERAMRGYEKVLELSPGHAGALEALARLREVSGDAHAALSAIEALASKANTPEGKAEQWMRAARLLEGRGDRDGAIERYKLALESNPKDTAAAVAK